MELQGSCDSAVQDRLQWLLGLGPELLCANAVVKSLVGEGETSCSEGEERVAGMGQCG